MNSSIDLSIVVPAYNEEGTIEEALSRLHKEITKSGKTFEIILVVDGRVDNTEKIALSLNMQNLRVISYEQNQGKGYALRTGAQEISGSVTAFFDGDLDIDASCLIGLYQQLDEGDADVVVGSKVHPDSVVFYPPWRRFQSRIMRLLVRTLFDLDIGDTQTGIKIFRTARLKEVIDEVQTTGFSFDVDLLVRMHDRDCKIVEGANCLGIPIFVDHEFEKQHGCFVRLTQTKNQTNKASRPAKMKLLKRIIVALEEIINLRSSMFVGLAFILSTGLNYGFQIMSGRYLGSYEYGLLAGLISVMSISTVALSAFQIQTAKAISAGQVDFPSKFFDRHLSNVTKFASVTALAFLCLTPLASLFWNIGLLPIIFVCMYIVPASWDSIAAGRFQGGKNFAGLAGYSLAQAIMKFVSLLVVIGIGFGVTSIIGLITVSATFVALLGIYRNKELGRLKINAFDSEIRRVFLTNALFWLMLSMDIVLAPGILGKNAGNYAAASTICKALLWTPALATQILFPHLSSRNLSTGGMLSLIRKGTFFTLGVALSSAVILSFVGPLMIESLYGSSFDGGGNDLWRLCFALVPFAVCQFLISVHFVNGHSLLLSVMCVMVILEGGALLFLGTSIASFSLILGLTGLLLSIALILFGENARAFFGTNS